MTMCPSLATRSEFERLRDLTGRIGEDPLLSQGSTGNSSIKLNGELWIKASGRWMAAAPHDDIFVRLSLSALESRLRQGIDPAEDHPQASIETAMHVAIPRAVVIHLHSVDAIAWAVRADGPARLRERLSGMRWQWVPYLPSGLRLARGIEDLLARRPDIEVFLLANHGLIVAGDSVADVELLLDEVQRRLNAPRRFAHPANYSVLAALGAHFGWDVPGDDGMHALGTDPISRKIISEGILYPCQAIFSGRHGLVSFRPVAPASSGKEALADSGRPFLILDGCGVLVSRSISPAALAMLSGLAQVVQRVNAAAPIQYLRQAEIAAISPEAVHRYCELANEYWPSSQKAAMALTLDGRAYESRRRQR